MEQIKLPDLKRLEVIDYSLYAQKPSFSYDFVKGVNLIIGGNGLGKTTFINLIKYGLIGRYNYITDVRTYREKKIEKRYCDDYNYFSDRMNSNYENNENAKVILTFSIDDIEISVTRSLYNLSLLNVLITENNSTYKLEGEIISQRKYDNITLKEIDKKKLLLQYKFEEFVKEKCNFAQFDDLIFFVNNILLFDESRSTLLWNKEIQIPLLSKYFNPPELDAEIEDLKREIKYYDSLSRHKQEDIRAINNLLKRRNPNIQSVADDLLIKSSKLKRDLNQLENKKNQSDNNLENERKSLQDIVSNKVQINKQISSLEEKISEIRNDIFKEIWDNLNPKYETFLKNITINHSCPLCNNYIYNKSLQDKIANNKCIICDHDLENLSNETTNTNIKEYELKIESLLLEKRNIEKLIINKQKNLNELESISNKFILDSLKLKDSIHKCELEIQKLDINNDDTSLNLIYEELKELEVQKNKYIEKRDELRTLFNNKQSLMEEKVLLATKDVSNLFSGYANNFLGIYSKLVYDLNPSQDEKMYIPYIGTSNRYTHYSLSESQSFFIDQSFRFSLIDFFNMYRKFTSFYICETPDSSLDISYEINAAKIFLDFSNKPNTLIMTSNFNNSTFIEYIIKNSIEINYINLLDIGNVTNIQNSNLELNKISEKIEVMINEQKHKS